jgi:hypothetical protein
MVPNWAGVRETERASLSSVRALLSGYPTGSAYCAQDVGASPKNHTKHKLHFEMSETFSKQSREG